MNKVSKKIQSDIYFKIHSKLGIPVSTTKAYWHIITGIKHPALKGKEVQVKKVLSNPDEIRVSKKDKTVLLFYKSIGKYYLCVVIKILKKRAFIITAYKTEKIKEGELKWKR
ncbi:MAG: DUF4258 domain-containing protein [Candidatus Omnitrophota bacterium]